MKGKLHGAFVSIGDLYDAYRKAKVEAFYENTHFHALAFTEFEQNLHKNLTALHSQLLKNDFGWSSDLSLIGTYGYLPKSVDCGAWGDSSEGHFRALDPLLDWKQRFSEEKKPAVTKFRLVIRPTVNFQIVSALWILKVGHLFDGVINSNNSYGNRLRRSRGEFGDARNSAPPINQTAIGLFNPYFSDYRKWRENGLSSIESSLNAGDSILAVTMDIEQFYHRVSPKFLLRPAFLRAINLKLSRQELLFTRALLQAIEVWYKSTPDYANRPEGAIPVGLSASKIIANVLLADFDKSILNRLKPIYYGRYVDDIFLVIQNSKNLSSATQLATTLASTLTPELQLRVNDNEAPSLQLNFPYAKDSQLIFAGAKQKIFALSSTHGLDLIRHIREQMRIQSSEYRLLPSVPSTGTEMASRALLATPNATLQVDALRKADVVSVKRLGISILIRDVEAHSADLRPNSWIDIRKEFYGLVSRHMLTPSGFFEFFGFIPRVFGLMLSCRDMQPASKLIDDLKVVADLLRETTTAGDLEQRKQFTLCLAQYAHALRQSALQAASERNTKVDLNFLRILRRLKILEPKLSLPTSLARLDKLVHQMLLADWGRRSYKDFWYHSQKTDEPGPPVPRKMEIKRKIRLGGIRRFRENLTDLKVPHWPALAFPTRPLRVDEIALVAPRILNDPILFKRTIMVLRGAKVASAEGLGISPLPTSAKDDAVLTFAVPKKKSSLIKCAITSFETTELQWRKAAESKQDRSLSRYENLNRLVNRILQENPTPDYIVFPELSIPMRWALRIARKLASNNVSLLAGIEYHRDAHTKALRNDSLISLVTNWPGYLSHVVRLQPKFTAAHPEKKALSALKLKKKTKLFEPTGDERKPTLYIHGDFCFSVLICSDLTNVEHRHHLRGGIDALFALEWNKDTKTFSSLVEATANDLHAYVVQVNNRAYGDSRLRVPAEEDYLRDLVQVKGGVSDYFVIGEINYQALRREQRRPPSKKNAGYKPVPIGYKMSLFRRLSDK